MPPELPHGLHDRRGARREPDRAARVRFRRAVTLMVMTLVLPGSAQLVAGNKQVGRIAMRVFLGTAALVLLVLLVSTVWSGLLFELAEKQALLGFVRLALIAMAIGWAMLFMDAWRLGQPLTLVRKQRLTIVGINGALCFTVAGTLLVASQMVGTSRDFLAVFGSGPAHAASEGRHNVLLLGSDQGAGRWGMRPDSLTVASIDEDTGRTVLISLPRNMENFRFAEGSVMDKEFPDGFDCEECYLNGVATWAGDHTELFGDSEDPGVDATVMAVEGITGLDIGYWAIVDLNGFKGLVDAVGGVTLNVRDRIPIGLPGEKIYDHIEPGVKRLNGFETLWYARARDGSDDYSRMARQKCVMNAMLQQVDPQTVVRNFGKIAKAGKAMFKTNLPDDQVGDFAQLALKAKDQKISTLSLVPPMIDTGDPDLDLVREKVQQAIDKAEGNGGRPGTPKRKASTPTTGGSLGSLKDGYVANQAEDLASAC
jgi:LCP family protein required for cell wall assembly